MARAHAAQLSNVVSSLLDIIDLQEQWTHQQPFDMTGFLHAYVKRHEQAQIQHLTLQAITPAGVHLAAAEGCAMRNAH